MGSIQYSSREKWVTDIEKVRSLRLNEEADVIALLCATFGVSATYITYRSKENIVISFIALGDSKSLSAPVHFFYSAFWVQSDLSDTKYCECVTDFLNQLRRTYDNIDIRLPVEITDVRPFLWNSFSVKNYYTYVKDLADSTYHPSTVKNIRKTSAKSYVCKEEELTDQSLALNIQLLKDLKVFWRGGVDKIAEMFVSISKTGRLRAFNCYLDDKLIASNIIFLDSYNKIAYTVLLNRVSSEIKDDIHSLLHHFFFTQLKNKGFLFVDLMGGDIQNIAAFKARLNTILTPHFVVSYSKNQNRIKESVSAGKQLIKKIIASF